MRWIQLQKVRIQELEVCRLLLYYYKVVIWHGRCQSMVSSLWNNEWTELKIHRSREAWLLEVWKKILRDGDFRWPTSKEVAHHEIGSYAFMHAWLDWLFGDSTHVSKRTFDSTRSTTSTLGAVRKWKTTNFYFKLTVTLKSTDYLYTRKCSLTSYVQVFICLQGCWSSVCAQVVSY